MDAVCSSRSASADDTTSGLKRTHTPGVRNAADIEEEDCAHNAERGLYSCVAPYFLPRFLPWLLKRRWLLLKWTGS